MRTYLTPGQRLERLSRILSWSQSAIESRKRNGIPDWFDVKRGKVA